ncbi:hypothetical protein HYE62_02795, partial [Aggregatibacter actinomycetemcomitans]|nr:hypothetical protein [Aggregatibacter actinomycetemcomitans]MBN6083164.1 hypothetical protein [Aggregatibacter actinomycetemcomitans]
MKEKRWAAVKLVLGIILVAGIYYNFIDSRYKEMTWRNLELTFQPDKWAEKQYEYEVSDEDPNLTRWGETKEEFLISMKEHRKEKAGLIIGYIYFLTGFYFFSFIYFLWPTKRRVRFDRKRGIIYTYVNKTFYLTEVNKLMRPFPEYIAFMGGMISFWVHPYQQAKYFANAIRGSQVVISDYTMWLPMVFMMFPGMYQRSKGTVLKRFLVDFMNPDTPPERIAS